MRQTIAVMVLVCLATTVAAQDRIIVLRQGAAPVIFEFPPVVYEAPRQYQLPPVQFRAQQTFQAQSYVPAPSYAPSYAPQAFSTGYMPQASFQSFSMQKPFTRISSQSYQGPAMGMMMAAPQVQSRARVCVNGV